MRSLFLLSAAALPLFLFGGCSSDKPSDASARKVSTHEQRIAAIVELMTDLNKKRRGFMDEHAKSTTAENRLEIIARGQEQVLGLDCSKCPRDFRRAFGKYQESLANYLPVMKFDLAPWSAGDFRGQDNRVRSDPTRSLHDIEVEYERDFERAKQIRAELKESFAKLQDVARTYGVSVANANPFRGALAE